VSTKLIQSQIYLVVTLTAPAKHCSRCSWTTWTSRSLPSRNEGLLGMRARRCQMPGAKRRSSIPRGPRSLLLSLGVQKKDSGPFPCSSTPSTNVSPRV